MATYTGSDRRLAYLFANGGGGECKVISGYYHDGDFYEDQSYTQIITGDTECLYIDLDTTTLYLFDGTDYVEVQGGGGSGGGSYACDLLLENTDFSIASGSATSERQYTLSASIENYDAVLVIGYTNVNANEQNQAVSMIVLKASYNIGSSVRWTYLLNGSIPNNNRRLAFGFSDSTTIQTAASRVQYEEPRLYRVYGMNFGGTAHTYSTTEQVVGTWIDGKPLYEISFSEVITNMTSGNQYQILDLTASAIDNVVKIDGGYFYETNLATDKRFVAQGAYCSLEYAENDCILYGRQSFTSTTSNRTYTWIGTIQFTKSTD